MNKITPKGWGYEHTLVNNEYYCGKLLFFVKDHGCSFHYHLIKAETFYIHSGRLLVMYSDHPYPDDFIGANLENHPLVHKTILIAGETFDVPPGRIHRMVALENTELFEFSTTDFPEDSYRVIKGD